MLAKGPAAVVLAGGAIAIWALATSQLARSTPAGASACYRGILCRGAAVVHALRAAQSRLPARFIFQHNFERYLTPLFQHHQPFWFFVPITILALLPWSAFSDRRSTGKRSDLWREKSWKNSPGFFFACWAFFPVVFFSFSQSKLPSYILPAVPALALIASIGAEPRVSEKSVQRDHAQRRESA